MNSPAIAFYCSLVIILVTCCVHHSHGRVSKSFVRGFLVGYAKGLEEGKNLVQLQPMVHSVACAFHPLPESEPELHLPHHEPNHIGEHEPRHESHHSHHSHHHEHGYSASNSHASNIPGQGLSSSNIASHVPPPQAANSPGQQLVNSRSPVSPGAGLIGPMQEDKKAGASSVIEKTVKQPYKA